MVTKVRCRYELVQPGKEVVIDRLDGFKVAAGVADLAGGLRWQEEKGRKRKRVSSVAW